MEDGSLARFLEGVEVEEIPGEVSREYEVARIISEWQGKGPAIVFRIRGLRQMSASNLIDTRSKLYNALGVGNDIEAYNKLLQAQKGGGDLAWEGAPKLVEAPEGLLSLPAAKFYEGEGGLYVSSSIFIACRGGICNSSIHRMMVVDRGEARVRIVPRHLYKLYKDAVDSGEDLPVTIIIGVNPVIMLASALTPPLGIFELGIAARLLGGLRVYESPLHGNPVPVGAAAVVEGRLTRRLGDEGPYVDALMTYDRVRKQPVLVVDRVYLNPDELTHVILSGGLEHVMLMGFPREAQIWDSVSRVVPRVYKVRLTPSSGGWLHAVVSIEKNHDGDGKNAIMAAFSGHPSLKHVVVVDGDIDPDDPAQVEWAIATRFQADKDLVLIRNARGSTLDPSADNGLTSKMGIDATVPISRRSMFRRGRIP